MQDWPSRSRFLARVAVSFAMLCLAHSLRAEVGRSLPQVSPRRAWSPGWRHVSALGLGGRFTERARHSSKAPVRRGAGGASAFRFWASGNDAGDREPEYVDLLKGDVGSRDLGEGDHIVSLLSADGDVAIKVIRNTNSLKELIRRQDLSALAADALGRATVCSTLLAAGKKNGETMQLAFAGEGPLKGILSIAEADGASRGYVGNPTLDLPLKKNGQNDVATAIGPGVLRVVKNHPDWPVPYNGITDLKTGTVAEDVATYLADSEQRRTAIGAGVAFHPDADDVAIIDRVAAAGGFIVELLPGFSEAAAEQVEANVFRLLARSESPASFMAAGTTPRELAEELTRGLGAPRQLLMSKAYFRCDCSKERFKNALKLLPDEELEDIMEKGDDVEAKCELCGQKYSITTAEVQADVITPRQQA